MGISRKWLSYQSSYLQHQTNREPGWSQRSSSEQSLCSLWGRNSQWTGNRNWSKCLKKYSIDNKKGSCCGQYSVLVIVEPSIRLNWKINIWYAHFPILNYKELEELWGFKGNWKLWRGSTKNTKETSWVPKDWFLKCLCLTSKNASMGSADFIQMLYSKIKPLLIILII